MNNFPQEALAVVKRNLSSESEKEGGPMTPAGSGSLSRRLDVETRLDPGVVARPNWNPWSLDSRLSRKAKEEACEARLSLFRDNVLAIREANRIFNAAALVAVMSAAEACIIEIRSLLEVRKQRLLDDARILLLGELQTSLEKLERFRGQMADELVGALAERFCFEFAERVHKIALLDFEFDKSHLLKIGASPLPA